MKKKILSVIKSISVVLSAIICVWCVGIKVSGVSAADSISSILLAAGLKTDDDGASAPQGGGDQEPGIKEENIFNEGMPNQGNLVINEDDGTLPFHDGELPVIKVTPDPNRSTLPVAEIAISGGTQIDNFFIKDSTGSSTDLAAQLLQDPEIDIAANGEVEVLLYHTHTSESYLEAAQDFYYTDMETRSGNQDLNVVAVGEEIKAELEKYGIGVVHDTTVCDTAFNGSYSRSWEVIQDNLSKYPTIKITIDIHRDSMTTEEGVKYKPTAQIEGRNAAQMMLIAGCNANGDWEDFPDWIQNLRLDMRVQQKAEELYPGLMRPLTFANSKYNTNATYGSMLVEVGTEVNTISEAKYSGKLLGKILGELLTEPWS